MYPIIIHYHYYLLRQSSSDPDWFYLLFIRICHEGAKYQIYSVYRLDDAQYSQHTTYNAYIYPYFNGKIVKVVCLTLFQFGGNISVLFNGGSVFSTLRVGIFIRFGFLFGFVTSILTVSMMTRCCGTVPHIPQFVMFHFTANFKVSRKNKSCFVHAMNFVLVISTNISACYCR
jgi:hypothetical protein